MHLGEAREVLMQTSLREFAVYLVFLAILCIVTLSSMNQTMYRYTDIIRNQFSSHSSVNQIGAFWKVDISVYL